MPFKEQHLQQVKHNEAFIENLKRSNDFYSWQIVGLFYSALHYIEAFLAKKGNHSFSHENRHNRMDTLGLVDDDFRGSYDCLSNWARMARYDCKHFNELKVNLMRIEYKKVRKYIDQQSI